MPPAASPDTPALASSGTDAGGTPDGAELTLRTPRVYAVVLALTLGTIALALLDAVALGSAAFVVLFVAVVATGIPHGAVDHLVAARLYGLSSGWRDQLLFYGVYLALMSLYGAAWLVAPVACLALFLVMTMYHFGQADLAYVPVTGWAARAVFLSRGLLLMGLPIAAFPEVVAPIFAAIAGADLVTGSVVATHAGAVLAALVAQHALALAGVAALGGRKARQALPREALNTAVLTALFVLVDPLVAFAVYFGLWHSLGHILELMRFFGAHGDEPATLTSFYREAALYTVVSFLGLGMLYAANAAFGLEEQMLALLFILISMLTLPHMLVVERLYMAEGKV